MIRNSREQDGIIYTSVTSDGTTGPEWNERLQNKGFQIDCEAESVLHYSPDFHPTSGVTTEIAVIKGRLFKNSDRIVEKIRIHAKRLKLAKPNAEVACLIRENFSDETMTTMSLFRIVTMHEPLGLWAWEDYCTRLLVAEQGDGGRWLRACSARPDYGWDNSDCGFAFAVAGT